MTANKTVTLTREEYDALLERTAQLEDRLAASEAERDARVPHEVALAIMGGTSPVRAFRDYQETHLARALGALGRLTQLSLRD